ncbi:MAG: hypothetical protein AAFN27_20765 [Pseudomonadota bacterium]
MISTNMRALSVVLTGSVSALALSVGVAAAEPAANALNKIAELESTGVYLSGDKHNHTTCTDGAMAVQTVVNESLITYDLDWFAQTGHGGSGNRDCRFDDPEYDGSDSGSGDFWTNTVGEEGIKGDENSGRMWRWQSLTEFAFPLQESMGQIADEPAWLGLEHNVPGHEHISMAITDGQFDRKDTNAFALGQFEYLFDRGDRDTSGGEENDFENPANGGIPKPGVEGGEFNGDLLTGDAGHAVAVQSIEFLANRFGKKAYYVPAHVERQGGFVSDENRGYNVEHFRDFHNAGLLNPRKPQGQSIVFGAEMLAGHQFANGGRGTYEADRPTAGFGTYGGAGAYSGAEISVAGFDFDGNEITNAKLTEVREELNALFEDRLTEPSGSDQYDQLDACDDCPDPAPEGIGTSAQERFVLGRPGIKTMWDAMLGEGRRFFNFGSSDWHNRGVFGPFEPQSTLDPWPGEYNKIYAYADGTDGTYGRVATREIIEGMREGNSWSVMGDLIDSFHFVMCQNRRCATMGEELQVKRRGGPVTWVIKLRDPEGANNSPYTFDNPSLVQIGQSVPLNEPVLSHIDIIRGDVTGIIDPEDPEYTTNVANPTTELFDRVDNLAGEFTTDGEFLIASGKIRAKDIRNDMYFRVRGTNMPVGTPNETNADGNPLLDDFSSLIPCTATGLGTSDQDVADSSTGALAVTGNSSFRARNAINATFDPTACPDHLPVDATGQKFLDADVEAWADLWFYANPIFIKADDRRNDDDDDDRKAKLKKLKKIKALLAKLRDY